MRKFPLESNTSKTSFNTIHIERARFRDHRGFFAETYSRRRYEELGIDAEFVQDNHPCHMLLVRCGVAFSGATSAQGKLVRCGRGAIFDVAVDIQARQPDLWKVGGL